MKIADFIFEWHPNAYKPKKYEGGIINYYLRPSYTNSVA